MSVTELKLILSRYSRIFKHVCQSLVIFYHESNKLSFTRFFIRNYRKRNFYSVNLTTQSRNDGGGAQIDGEISVYILCKFLGARYVRRKISYVDHEGSNGNSQKILDDWNNIYHPLSDSISSSNLRRIINLETEVFLLIQLMFSIIPKIRLLQDFVSTITVSIPHGNTFIKCNPDILDEYKSEIQLSLGYLRQQGVRRLPEIPRNSLAVHVRRGDVNSSDFTRYTSDSEILKQINFIASMHMIDHIFVFSHNYVQLEFVSQLSNCVQLRNLDSIETLCFMARCDYLLIAKASSYSFIAALSSHGRIFVNNEETRAPSSWHRL